jgi:sulfur-carrier protein
MAVVLLPSLLAAEAGGRSRFEVEVESVEDALRALPVANLVFDERGELRPLVNVYVDGVDVRDRDGLATKLADGETIRLVAAIAGGQAGRLMRNSAAAGGAPDQAGQRGRSAARSSATYRGRTG